MSTQPNDEHHDHHDHQHAGDSCCGCDDAHCGAPGDDEPFDPNEHQMQLEFMAYIRENYPQSELETDDDATREGKLSDLLAKFQEIKIEQEKQTAILQEKVKIIQERFPQECDEKYKYMFDVNTWKNKLVVETKKGFDEANASMIDPSQGLKLPPIVEVTQHVYQVKMYENDFLKEISEFIKYAEEWLEKNEFNLIPPNSMNRYGLSLEYLGLGPLFVELTQYFFQSIVPHYYPFVLALMGDDEEQEEEKKVDSCCGDKKDDCCGDKKNSCCTSDKKDSCCDKNITESNCGCNGGADCKCENCKCTNCSCDKKQQENKKCCQKAQNQDDEKNPDNSEKIENCGCNNNADCKCENCQCIDCKCDKKSIPQEKFPIIFDNVHTFTVQYRLEGEKSKDIAVKTPLSHKNISQLNLHTDASHLTLNLCLGEEFSDGKLFLKGHRCMQHQQIEINAETSPFSEEQLRETSEQVSLDQVPGSAYIHSGTLRHGAEPISGGFRQNLIIWAVSNKLHRNFRGMYFGPCFVCAMDTVEGDHGHDHHDADGNCCSSATEVTEATATEGDDVAKE